jgi:hypothetical protein
MGGAKIMSRTVLSRDSHYTVTCAIPQKPDGRLVPTHGFPSNNACGMWNDDF